MIYLTVGTMFMDFPRLIDAVDAIAGETGERTVIQIGMGATTPKHCECFAFKPREEVLQLQREARVIIAHAGIGCVLDALQVRRPLLVVPRLKNFGEHMDDHQLQIAEAVERRNWGRMILDVTHLQEACRKPPEIPERYCSSSHRLVWAVRDRIDRIAIKKAIR